MLLSILGKVEEVASYENFYYYVFIELICTEFFNFQWGFEEALII